jgi:hypothetical protein
MVHDETAPATAGAIGGDALAEALAAASRGWPVLPVVAGGKVPLLKNWPRLASIDALKVEVWSKRHSGCNFGLLCGKPSGLIVLDVDPRNGGTATLADLERERGDLPATPEVATGGGGRHLYLRHPGGRIGNRIIGPGLDLKADGGYVVLPGSTHESGCRYRWRSGFEPDDVEVAEPPPWLVNAFLTHAYTCNGSAGRAAAAGGDAAAVLDDPDVRPLVDVAIAGTLPTRHGTRNRCIFDLARRMKSIAPLANLNAADLRPIVLDWFNRALPNVRTKLVSVTLADFATAWQRVERPHGQLLTTAMQAAVDADDPPALPEHYGEAERLAVRFCRSMHRLQGGGSWFLSCRDLAERMKACGTAMNHDDAAKLLRVLVADGILVVEAAGQQRRGGRATTYRYLLPDA